MRNKKIIFLSLCFLVATGFAYLLVTLPDISPIVRGYPVTQHNKKDKISITVQRQKPHNWVSLESISPEASGAVIISEDWAFYDHSGYDPQQIYRIIKDSLWAMRLTRGASTITQQVARNVFLTKNKTIIRKIRELCLAYQIEKRVSKKRILEIYFNIAHWGYGIFGIRDASEFYFQKLPLELNAKEGAFLAMLLPSPKRYSVSHREGKLSPYAQKTVDTILDKMVQAQYITQEYREEMGAFPLFVQLTEEL